MDRRAAETLAAALDTGPARLHVCSLCLYGVASALAAGDEREVRRAIRFFAPLLWDEGLDAPVRVALDQAAVKGIPGAEAAITDVEARGPRSRVVEAIVRRLAAQMLEGLERGYASSLN